MASVAVAATACGGGDGGKADGEREGKRGAGLEGSPQTLK